MIWIAGGSLYEAEGGEFRPLDVGIEHERIADVVPAARVGVGDTVIDASGAYLLPGLIDCHVHLTMRSQDPDPSSNASRPDAAIVLYAASAARRTLLGGVTSVRDVGGWNYVEMALREAIGQGLATGPRLFLAGRLLSITTGAAGYYPGMYEVANGPDEVREAVRTQLAHGADLIKVMATGAMLSPEDEDARVSQYDVGELSAAVRAARDENNKHVAAHAHGREGIQNAIEAGVASIEHGTFADEAVLREMAQRGTFLVPTLCTGPPIVQDEGLSAAMPRHLRARLMETHRTHVEAVRLAHALGVPIAMGTDAGTPGNHHGRNADECVLLVEEVGMSPREAIRAATIHPARLLRQEDNLGTVDRGKDADLIGCRGDPTEDIRELTRVAFVMKGGAVYRNELGT